MRRPFAPFAALCALVLVLVALGVACAPESPSPTDPGSSSMRPGETSGGNLAAPPRPVPRDDLDPDMPVNCDPFVYPHEPDRLVVRHNSLRSPADTDILDQHGAEAKDSFGFLTLYEFDAGTDLRQLAAELTTRAGFDSAEPSTIYYFAQEIILGFFETGPDGMEVPPDTDWEVRTDLSFLQDEVTGNGVTVAVLDSGVDAEATGTLFARLSPDGHDFVGDDEDPFDENPFLANDAHGHGTLVADIVHQVAPDATILPLRVMDPSGKVLAWHVMEAIFHAIDNGASVINMSFGGCVQPQFVESMFEMAWSQGIVLVGSGGNEGGFEERHYPSGSPYVCAVGATDASDVRALFSTYCSAIDIAAPGVGIIGEGPEGLQAIGAGTSFAAPMVAGAVAAAMESPVPLTPDEYRTALRDSGLPLISDSAYLLGFFGGGRIDFDGFFDATTD